MNWVTVLAVCVLSLIGGIVIGLLFSLYKLNKGKKEVQKNKDVLIEEIKLNKEVMNNVGRKRADRIADIQKKMRGTRSNQLQEQEKDREIGGFRGAQGSSTIPIPSALASEPALDGREATQRDLKSDSFRVIQE